MTFEIVLLGHGDRWMTGYTGFGYYVLEAGEIVAGPYRSAKSVKKDFPNL